MFHPWPLLHFSRLSFLCVSVPLWFICALVVGVDGAVAMDVEPARGPALCFQNTVQLRGAVLCHIHAGRDAAVIGDHDILPILVNDPHRLAVEEIAVLPKDVDFRSFANDRIGREHEDVVEFLP